jgi:hypothetical protein
MSRNPGEVGRVDAGRAGSCFGIRSETITIPRRHPCDKDPLRGPDLDVHSGNG